MELKKEQLHASISDPAASSMNFLNEVSQRFPEAISLAAGRPFEGFFRTEDISKYIDVYLDHVLAQTQSPELVRRTLMQYGRTNGQIHALVARLLATDEGVHVPAEAIAITAGAQEGMVLALRGLCAERDDVLLATEPCYVGITGAARILDIDVVAVPESPSGLDPAVVAATAQRVRAQGRRPRALYLVSNFSNPSGVSLDLASRQRLLEVAAAEDLVIIEDDPYGLFGLEDEQLPSLKSLDRSHSVIYLGSFAKSVFPGARVGFLVADQPVVDGAGRRTTLAEELSAIKSMLTVNTSPIAQAVIGGVLVESGFSLRAFNSDKIAFYRNNLRTLLATLEESLAGTPVTWNVPSGGFFAVLTLPFPADEALLEISAREHGVLWTPMSFFYLDGGGECQLRVCASALPPEVLAEGVRRLAALIRQRL